MLCILVTPITVFMSGGNALYSMRKCVGDGNFLQKVNDIDFHVVTESFKINVLTRAIL